MGVRTIDDMIMIPSDTIALSSSNNNDVAIKATITAFIASTAGNSVLTGMMPPVIDMACGPMFVSNGSFTDNLVVPHQSTASSSGFAFYHHNGHNMTLRPLQSVLCYYVPTYGFFSFTRGTFEDTITGASVIDDVFVVDFTANYGTVTLLAGLTVTQSISGLATTDSVSVICIDGLPNAVSIANAYVSAVDTLTIQFVTTVTLGVNLPNANYRVTVYR